MKILFSNDGFTAQRRGGISRYFIELFKQFSSLGLDFHCFGGAHANELLREFAQVHENSSFVSHRPSKKPPGPLARLQNERRFRQVTSEIRPDIVHETYYPLLTTAHGMPTIVTVHDMSDEILGQGLRTRLKQKIRRKAARKATRLIAVSEATKNDMIRVWQIDPGKIDVIHHGVSKLPPPSAAPILGPYFLFVGKRGGYKNFTSTLQAYAASGIDRGIHFLCFGGGPFLKDEVKQIKKLGAGDRVHQIEGDDSVLSTCYKHAIGLLYTSQYEGFGLPLLEAMSAGCPVVACRVSSIPEIAGEAAYLIPPSNFEAIVEAIRILVSDNALKESLSASGKENIKRFSWETSAQQHIQVYEKAISS